MTPLFTRETNPKPAFERLYQAHVRDVYRYALMVVRNRDDAEDVVQTTFLKAYRALLRGERPRHARRWLITIAHNTCRTRLRDQGRRPHEVAFDDQLAATVEADDRDAPDPKELLRALGELTFTQRSALVMRELEGRAYSEIAEVLEVTPSAVETLLFRARRALREQLEGALTCGEAEFALSCDLDGRLARSERGLLRAHLRACSECASLARRQRARRAALRSLGPMPLPASLASWGGGAAVTTGVAAKIAAVVVAGAAATGVATGSAEAVPEPRAHDRAPILAAAPPTTQRVRPPLALAAARERAESATTPRRHAVAREDRIAPERTKAKKAGDRRSGTTPAPSRAAGDSREQRAADAAGATASVASSSSSSPSPVRVSVTVPSPVRVPVPVRSEVRISVPPPPPVRVTVPAPPVRVDVPAAQPVVPPVSVELPPAPQVEVQTPELATVEVSVSLP